MHGDRSKTFTISYLLTRSFRDECSCVHQGECLAESFPLHRGTRQIFTKCFLFRHSREADASLILSISQDCLPSHEKEDCLSESLLLHGDTSETVCAPKAFSEPCIESFATFKPIQLLSPESFATFKPILFKT